MTRFSVALLVLCGASLSNAAPKKKKPPPAPVALPAPSTPAPSECAGFEQCLEGVEERFGATDFEGASLLARRAEPLASADAQRAKLVLLQATLLFHSQTPVEPKTEDTIVSRFSLAQKLDPTLTALSIPAYARNQALEALWERAKPPAPPAPAPVVVREELVGPPPLVVVEERRRPIVPVVALALGVAGGAVGGVFGYRHFELRKVESTNTDLMNHLQYQRAEQEGTIAIVAVAAAGGLLLIAAVSWLLR